MCPFCLATVVVVAVGVMSTGGLTAMAMAKRVPAAVRNEGGKPEQGRTAEGSR